MSRPPRRLVVLLSGGKETSTSIGSPLRAPAGINAVTNTNEAFGDDNTSLMFVTLRLRRSRSKASR